MAIKIEKKLLSSLILPAEVEEELQLRFKNKNYVILDEDDMIYLDNGSLSRISSHLANNPKSSIIADSSSLNLDQISPNDFKTIEDLFIENADDYMRSNIEINNAINNEIDWYSNLIDHSYLEAMSEEELMIRDQAGFMYKEEILKFMLMSEFMAVSIASLASFTNLKIEHLINMLKMKAMIHHRVRLDDISMLEEETPNLKKIF